LFTEVAGRQVIVAGSWDRTIRIWDPLDDTVTTLDCLEPILAGTLVDGKVVCATGQALCAWTIPSRLSAHPLSSRPARAAELDSKPASVA
jgi:hypothetical protein